MTKTKIFIDTDGVADDVRAISLALQHPEVEIVAISSVVGCVSSDQAVANIARTLRANGKENVRVFKGAGKPLIGTGEEEPEPVFFGADGLGDSPEEWPQVLPEDRKSCDPNEHAALAMIRLFSADPGAIQLVCIGPLTNVALAIKLEAKFVKWPKNVVLMGGNVHAMGNVGPNSTAEFNFSHDPEAAHIVIKEMKCPITIIPWETFLLKSTQTSIDFSAHLSLDVPLAKFFNSATQIARKVHEKSSQQLGYCDEIAVGVAIDSNTVVTEKRLRGVVELDGKYTRGQLALSWMDEVWDHESPMRELTIVMDYNVQLLDTMIFDTIRRSAAKDS